MKQLKKEKMEIGEILDKYDFNFIEKIVLNYSGQIQEFESEWDIPEDIKEDEATYKLRNYVLYIFVK